MKKCFTMLALCALACATAAQAHVTLDQSTGYAGTYQKLAFRVGHGCDGKATTGLTVTLPEGASHAKPMPKAGWKIAVTDNGALHEISWKGGSLPDAYFDEFVIQVKLTGEPGKLYFRIVQECGKASVAWDEIAGANMKAPAPVLDVLPAPAGTPNHAH
ncbi:MAG TPA: YcnI family protein [Duganella sp.]|nr:YcnI family protein [Duganella sp.]